MDSSSTDQLDVELNDEGWIDVHEEQEENTDSDNRKSVNAKQTVVILDEDNDKFYLSSKTLDKSTSTVSLESDIKISNKKHSLKYWDKWLKVFVLAGAIISVGVLGIILFEEETKQVIKDHHLFLLQFWMSLNLF